MFKFFQKLAIKISLSPFVNKNKSANSVTNIIFFITITHRELERLRSVNDIALTSNFGAQKSRAARGDLMLDIPPWLVGQKFTQDWKSFSHSMWCKKFYEGSKNPISSKKRRKICRHQWVYKNSQHFKYTNVMIPTESPAYLGRVSCGYAERSPVHFLLWLKLFSLRKPSVNEPDKYGKRLKISSLEMWIFRHFVTKNSKNSLFKTSYLLIG